MGHSHELQLPQNMFSMHEPMLQQEPLRYPRWCIPLPLLWASPPPLHNKVLPIPSDTHRPEAEDVLCESKSFRNGFEAKSRHRVASTPRTILTIFFIRVVPGYAAVGIVRGALVDLGAALSPLLSYSPPCSGPPSVLAFTPAPSFVSWCCHCRGSPRRPHLEHQIAVPPHDNSKERLEFRLSVSSKPQRGTHVLSFPV